MPFDWQQIVSLIMVAATAVLLIWSRWRARQRRKLNTCGGDCSCASPKTIATGKIEASNTGGLPYADRNPARHSL